MNNEQSVTKLVSVLMLFATATLGWMNLRDKQTIPRIAEVRKSVQVPASEQDVVARLWEDPLQAVESEELSRGDKAKSDSVHGLERVATGVLKKATDRRVCLLVVPIPDTPFPDDLEVRLRLRYSVQMAMAQEGFAPDNRNALGFFKIATNSGQITNTLAVPYEWFVPRQTNGDLAVLTLWLPEVVLARDPLSRLADLCTNLVKLGPNDSRFAGLFVVGPRSSDTLSQFVAGQNSTADPKLKGPASLQGKLCIFSPEATAPDALIGLEPLAQWSRARSSLQKEIERRVAGGSSGKWDYFRNFIATDDQLTDLLVLELASRGIDLQRQSSDKILIFAEADTQYGRSLPLSFQASLASYRNGMIRYSEDYSRCRSATPKTLVSYHSNAPPDPQLLVYRYLRGLDQQKGYQGGTKAVQKPSATSAEEVLTAVLSRNLAMAMGESQLDYVDRLGDQIRASNDTGTIKAVGILGADLYDKLILLRSLRSRFPDAVFFTTDLDARLWHDEHLAFTRNMIVASAFGVTVPESSKPVQAGYGTPKIPPFRDGYQVAVFNACRAALKKATVLPERPTSDTEASIFEIGRNGATKLKPISVGAPDGFFNWLGGESNAIHIPRVLRWLANSDTGLLLLGIGGVALAGWMKFLEKDKIWLATTKVRPWLLVCTGGSIILLASFCILTQNLAEVGGGEPWQWCEGVSIWPTELIRLFVICAVITTMVWSWKHHVSWRDKLEASYGFRKFKGLHTSAHSSAERAFYDYVERAKPRARFFRVACATFAYLAFGFGLVFLVDRQMPLRPHVRGNIARELDMFLLIASVVSFLGLIFYVLDAVLLSVQLLREVSREATCWPVAVLRKARERFNVMDEDLSGYLAVSFAAEKSQETGRLILLPFAIQFLFVLSRNSYFDRWTWPGTLIAIFTGNILLACAAWMILRRAAGKIKKDALFSVDNAIRLAANERYAVVADEGISAPGQNSLSALYKRVSRLVVQAVCAPTGKDNVRLRMRVRQAGLLHLKRVITDEDHGAYAHFFQDPALIALLLPSGVFGIISVLVQALFSES